MSIEQTYKVRYRPGTGDVESSLVTAYRVEGWRMDYAFFGLDQEVEQLIPREVVQSVIKCEPKDFEPASGYLDFDACCAILRDWLKPISRWFDVEKMWRTFEKNEDDFTPRAHIELFTASNKYRITFRPSVERDSPEAGPEDGYLGCTVTSRKERPGEDWKRGNDLADGAFHFTTWERIVADIVGYELGTESQPQRTPPIPTVIGPDPKEVRRQD